jgi:hypothetical protein
MNIKTQILWRKLKMKKFNIAALPLAVAGVLASSNAFAGTEACFESYRVADDAIVAAHDTLYTPASCDATPTVAGATELQAVSNAKVAFELTGDYDIDLEDFNAANERQHIVYIPTTDIPPASRIQMQLTGADFGEGNADQMYLVVKDGDGDYQTIASSDGAFDNTDTVEFLTKAGVTIGAGSRLLLSSLNPEDVPEAGALVAGISIHLANTDTCNPDSSVTIAAISAKTDGNTSIAGAVSQTPVEILDISEQFALVTGADATNEVEVDAEDPSFRKKFVVEQSGGSWVGKEIEDQAFWEAKFTNDTTLDDFIVIDSDDNVTLSLKSTSSTGAGVTFAIWADKTDVADTSILDAAEADHIAGGATVTALDIDDNADDMVALTTSPVSYTIDADDVFQDDAATNNVTNIATVLENDTDEVMEFNYDVKATYGLDFNDDAHLDKVACEPTTPYSVGVNGAVLKVPYTFDIKSNWVRITSEHDTEATVFVDIFDEASNEIKNVNLGQLAGKTSKVYTVDWIIDQAQMEATPYAPTGKRHTMTFTVTAPKNKIHGVSVQAIPGGVDRVMPVLDQNAWNQ